MTVKVGALKVVTSSNYRYVLVRRLAADPTAVKLSAREERLRVVKRTDHLDALVAAHRYWVRRGVPAGRLSMLSTRTGQSIGAGGYGA